MKKLLNLTELAKYIEIPKRTLYRMVAEDRFPVPPVIQTYPRMWSVEQIDAWLAGRGE